MPDKYQAYNVGWCLLLLFLVMLEADAQGNAISYLERRAGRLHLHLTAAPFPSQGVWEAV